MPRRRSRSGAKATTCSCFCSKPSPPKNTAKTRRSSSPRPPAHRRGSRWCSTSQTSRKTTVAAQEHSGELHKGAPLLSRHGDGKITRIRRANCISSFHNSNSLVARVPQPRCGIAVDDPTPIRVGALGPAHLQQPCMDAPFHRPASLSEMCKFPMLRFAVWKRLLRSAH